MTQRLLAVSCAVLAIASSCGGTREFSGYVRTPAPSSQGISLPVIGGESSRELVASSGNLLAIYFGYTNCPDICPTTLQDLTVALRRLDDASRVEVAMVTVDPDRDLAVLDGYVKSFIPTAIALGTTDESELVAAAQPFGASYLVESVGADIEVAHSTSLYVVDDQGTLLLTWPFGVPSSDISADLNDLLDGRRS